MIKPNNIQIHNYELILTENCNLRCKYCFDDAFSNRTSCSYNYNMNIDIIDDLINFINETQDPNKVSVSFLAASQQ